MSRLPAFVEGESRGVSVVAVSLKNFGLLVIMFSLYQAQVVPEQNSDVEFEHHQETQSQMVDLRSNAVLMPESQFSRATTVNLGVRYPSRTIFVNPGPATGSLYTDGTDSAAVNVTIRNAEAVSAEGETGDLWNGAALTYDTGVIEHTVDYNRYKRGTPIVYEHSVVHNQIDGGERSVPITGQSMVEGTRISVIALNGSLSEDGTGVTSVDFDPLSTQPRVVEVNNTGGPITLEFASRMNASVWEDTFEDQLTSNGGHIQNVSFLRDGPDEFSVLELTLEPDQRYTLELTKVGVGSGTTETDPAYLTDVAGTDTPVRSDSTRQLVVEARDKFNVPQSGVEVKADPQGGSFIGDTDNVTGSEGQATFLYDPNQVGTHRINFSIKQGYTLDSEHDASTPKNVSVSVRVTQANNNGSSGGPYKVDWYDDEENSPNGPAQNNNAVTYDSSADRYEYNVSQAGSLDLTMYTSPGVDSAKVEYAVSDRSVATLSPTSGVTDASGENVTTLQPQSNGLVTVYTSSGGSGDQLRINITGVSSGVPGLSSPRVTDIVPNADSQQQTFTFTLEDSISNGDNVTITVVNPPGQSTLGYGDSVVDDEGEGGEANIDQNGNTTITYEPDSTTPAGTTVEIRADDMTVGPENDHNNPYDVTFERSDTSGVETLTFDVSRNIGNANLTNVSVETLSGTGTTTQEITFEPTTDMYSVDGTNEQVGIDLSNGANLYDNAGVRTVTPGSANLNTGGGSAWVVYNPNAGISAGTPITITLEDVEPTTTGQTYEVGFSRGSADTTDTTFSVENLLGGDGTILYQDDNSDNVAAIAGDGGTVQTLSPSSVGALGPIGEDLDSDGAAELAYLDSGNLNIVDTQGNINKLVDSSDPGAPRTTKALMATETWNGSGPSVFYAGSQSDKVYRTNASTSSPIEVVDPSNGANAVLDTGDIDGDGSDELVFLDGSQSVRYLNQDGSVNNLANAGAGSNNGVGAGELITINGTVWVTLVDGSNNIKLVTDSGGNRERTIKPKQTPGGNKGTAKSPITSADVDDDGNSEIVYLGKGNNKLRYVDNPLGSSAIKELEDSNGQDIKADSAIGVVSA